MVFRNSKSAEPRLRFLLANIFRHSANADLSQRIQMCDEALHLVKRKEDPVLWAGLECILGLCLGQYQLGDRSMNLERAIVALNESLTVLTCKDFQEQWGEIHNNLGNAYCNRMVLRAELIGGGSPQ